MTVVSSNTKVASVNSPQVVFNGGDQQSVVSFKAVAPGTATLTLSGGTYDFTAPQSSIVVTVK
jgi:hypothetical protein